MTGFLLFTLQLVFSASALAQVGMPGVSYNGGKSEKEICTRKSNPRPACASFFTKFADTQVVIGEKAHFWANCQLYYRQIAREAEKIDRLERDCNEYVEAGTSMTARFSSGAGVEGIDAAKKVASDGATKLRACAAELEKFPPVLEKMEAQLDQKIEHAEAAEEKLKSRLAADGNTLCNGSDQMTVFFDLHDIMSRYKQGLKKKVTDASLNAEEAVKDYKAAADNLDGFVRMNSRRSKSLNSAPKP